MNAFDSLLNPRIPASLMPMVSYDGQRIPYTEYCSRRSALERKEHRRHGGVENLSKAREKRWLASETYQILQSIRKLGRCTSLQVAEDMGITSGRVSSATHWLKLKGLIKADGTLKTKFNVINYWVATGD